MKRNLTDEQFVTLATHFIGCCQPITSILQEFSITADGDSVEMELWVGGFKRCPGAVPGMTTCGTTTAHPASGTLVGKGGVKKYERENKNAEPECRDWPGREGGYFAPMSFFQFEKGRTVNDLFGIVVGDYRR